MTDEPDDHYGPDIPLVALDVERLHGLREALADAIPVVLDRWAIEVRHLTDGDFDEMADEILTEPAMTLALARGGRMSADRPLVFARYDGSTHIADPNDVRYSRCGLWIGDETWLSAGPYVSCTKCALDDPRYDFWAIPSGTKI